MKRLGLLSIFCAVLLLCVGRAMAVDVGPAKYFNMKEIRDESTLNTVIAKDSVVASKVRPRQERARH